MKQTVRSTLLALALSSFAMASFPNAAYGAQSRNTRPLINGTPITQVFSGENYFFQPVASDADHDPLTFVIRNKPDWAEFDADTGVLSGIPAAADRKRYSIRIGVTDGSKTRWLKPFRLNVLNHPPEISGQAEAKAVVGQAYRFTPIATDVENDRIRFRIRKKPRWARFNKETGELSGIPTQKHLGTTYSDIEITAIDAKRGKTALPRFAVTVTDVPVESPLAVALRTGDVTSMAEETLLEAALVELERRKETPALLNLMYGTEAIAYTPGNRSQLINIDPSTDTAFPILMGNKGKTLAIAGQTENARYAAFGLSPTELFEAGTHNDFVAPFNRLLAWLFGGEPVDTKNLEGERVIAFSYAKSDRNNIMAWVSSEHPGWRIIECNTVTELATCYSQADLIMTGWQGENMDAPVIRQALATSMQMGKPVLYGNRSPTPSKKLQLLRNCKKIERWTTTSANQPLHLKPTRKRSN